VLVDALQQRARLLRQPRRGSNLRRHRRCVLARISGVALDASHCGCATSRHHCARRRRREHHGLPVARQLLGSGWAACSCSQRAVQVTSLVCVCMCVCACARARVCACVRVLVCVVRVCAWSACAEGACDGRGVRMSAVVRRKGASKRTTQPQGCRQGLTTVWQACHVNVSTQKSKGRVASRGVAQGRAPTLPRAEWRAWPPS
jgi:hypothetical protein